MDPVVNHWNQIQHHFPEQFTLWQYKIFELFLRFRCQVNVLYFDQVHGIRSTRLYVRGRSSSASFHSTAGMSASSAFSYSPVNRPRRSSPLPRSIVVNLLIRSE